MYTQTCTHTYMDLTEQDGTGCNSRRQNTHRAMYEKKIESENASDIHVREVIFNCRPQNTLARLRFKQGNLVLKKYTNN